MSELPKRITEKTWLGLEIHYVLDEENQALNKVIDAKCGFGSYDEVIGEYRGFKILGSKGNSLTSTPEITLKGNTVYTAALGNSAVGNITRIENLAKRISDELDRTKQNLKKTEQQFAQAKDVVLQPFEFEDKLSELVARQSEINTKLEYDHLFKQQEKSNQEDTSESEDYDDEDEEEEYYER